MTTVAVHVNGESRHVPAGASVRVLLESLGLAAGRVAVELNGNVVPRARHDSTTITEGDRLEIVAFVGGG